MNKEILNSDFTNCIKIELPQSRRDCDLLVKFLGDVRDNYLELCVSDATQGDETNYTRAEINNIAKSFKHMAKQIIGDKKLDLIPSGAELRIPEYIRKKIRQTMDLEPDDKSKDFIFDTMTSNEAFEKVLQWEGILGYTSTIKSWIQDIYKVKLD